MATVTASLQVEDVDDIRILRFNRPERRNALSRQAVREICAELDDVDDDDNIRAVVFTGAGASFCVGADLSSGASTFASSKHRPVSEGDGARDYGGILTLRLFALTKPVLAAINGDAVGLGVTMTLPMDVRIATPETRFGFVFTRRGIVPEACSTWFLPRVVGINTALDWALSGRLISAEEALAAGLVQQLVSAESLLETVLDRARGLFTHGAPVSVAATRQMLWHALTLEHPMEAHRIESHLIRVLGAGPDAREGINAFLEKRSPAFPTGVREGLTPFRGWWRSPAFASATRDDRQSPTES